MGDIIKAKVAGILNSHEFVINAGMVKGVREGMVFSVLESSAKAFLDPDTHQDLGTISREKARLKIVRSEAKMALGVIDSFALSNMRSVRRKQFKNLAALGLFGGSGDEDEDGVEVGDIVEQVLEVDDIAGGGRQRG